MAKIIQLPQREIIPKPYRGEEGFDEFVNWVSEMNNLLQLIEKSLENTPAYATKNLNCRR